MCGCVCLRPGLTSLEPPTAGLLEVGTHLHFPMVAEDERLGQGIRLWGSEEKVLPLPFERQMARSRPLSRAAAHILSLTFR